MTELPLFHKNEDEEIKKLTDNDFKKEMKIKELKDNKKKIFFQIKKFYFTLFNKKNPSVRYIFFGFLLASYLELYLGNLSDMLILKFTMSIIFFVPLIIILVEFETFFKVCSLFEINSIFFIKGLVLFSINLSYKEILLFNFLQNSFHSIFVKKLYINTEFLGAEVKNRQLLKVNVFKSHLLFLIFGYIINTVFLLYLFLKGKLTFNVYDDLFPHYNIIYYGVFILLSSRKLLKFLYKIYNSQFYSEQIPKAKIIFFILIINQLMIIIYLSKNFVVFSYTTIIIILFWIFYETIGFLIYCILCITDAIKYLGMYYIEEYYSNNFQEIFYYNFFFVCISMILSLIFIISVFYMEKDKLSKTYTKIYERVFILKILFDIWLIINFIFRLYKNNPQTYYDNFYNIYSLLFLCFIFNYIIVYIVISLKLNIYVTEEDVNYYFEDLAPYISKTRTNNPILYGNYSPYVELKFYRGMIKFFSYFNEDMKHNKRNSKALKKILNFVIYSIFAFLALIINNSCSFYLVYFFIMQFIHSSFHRFGRKLYNIFNYVQFQIDDDDRQVLSKKIRQKKINKLKKKKYKLILIIIYPYLVIMWKLFISKFFLIFYEYFFAKIQFLLFGKLEPVGNVLYQLISKNNLSDSFSFTDIIIIFFVLLPNSICVLVTHINEDKPSFFFQNYLITSFIGIFIKVHPIILITGIVNIFLMLNIFASDEETYYTFFFWFDLFGVTASNISD